MDYIDRSVMTYEEIEESLKHLCAGDLIVVQENKVIIQKKAKKLLRPFSGVFSAVISWQLKVRDRIILEQYDETKLCAVAQTSKNEYDDALNKSNDFFKKEIMKIKKRK